MEDTINKAEKALSEKPIGFLLAMIGGLLGGWLGLILSPFVLFLLTKTMRRKDGKNPNRFLVWALIGIVGAPLSVTPFLEKDKKTKENQVNLSTQTVKRQSEEIVPTGIEEQVRADRSLTVNESRLLDSISVNNQFMETVSSKGGKLIAVYMTIRNTGKESGNMYWTTLQLVDSEGRKYNKIEDFTELLTINAWTKEQGLAEAGDQLFPGASAQTVAVFRVSPDAENLRLIANSSKYFSIE